MAVKLLVAGAAGRMGSRIVQMAQGAGCEVIYRLDSKAQTLLTDFADFGSDLDQIKNADIVIDFTVPEATLKIASKAAQYKKPMVIGTTGFSPAQEKELKTRLESIPVIKSANMSLAVNVLFKLAKETSRVLKDYGVKIKETHHIHKKDRPSGTALQAGKIMEEHLENAITYESEREGEVVGDHQIIFTGMSDRLELFHHAESRDIFVTGALVAAQWLFKEKPQPGFYSMQDVLGLK